MNHILDIIIVNYKTKDLTIQCIESIKNTINVNYKVFLVDNASKDGSVEAFKKEYKTDKNITIIALDKNKGFAGGNNEGLKKSTADFVLLLNSDCIVCSGAIEGMLEIMSKDSNVGISTCRLQNTDGSLQATGGHFPNLLRVFSWMIVQDLPGVDLFIKPFHPSLTYYSKQRELDWVTGAFMLVRRKVLKEIGDLDEDYFMYTEDVDYCFRAKRAGWKVVYSPKYSITHLGGASSRREYSILKEFEGVKIFYSKNYPQWQSVLLRFFLKTGSYLRAQCYTIINRKNEAKIYAKAFKAL